MTHSRKQQTATIAFASCFENQPEGLGISGKIILKRILENNFGEYGVNSSGLGQRSVVGPREHTAKVSGFVKVKKRAD
jgi:hypothetical protein